MYEEGNRDNSRGGRKALKGILSVVMCIALWYGGPLLWRQHIRPLIHYLRLERQDFSDLSEAGDFFPPMCEDGGYESVDIKIYDIFGTRVFTHQEMELVESGYLPDMGDDFEFSGGAYYNREGTVETLRFQWKRGPQWIIADITPAEHGSRWYEGRHMDTTAFEIANGARITRRGGIDIVCSRAGEKSMRFYKDRKWHQIYGNSGITDNELAEAADFFFRHPVSLGRFSQDKGGEIHSEELNEYPGAFAGYYPAPTAKARLDLLDDFPFHLECEYSLGTAPMVWEIYDMRYEWCNGFDWDFKHDAGDFDSLMKEDIEYYIAYWPEYFDLTFTWGPNYRIVCKGTGCGGAEQLWEVLCALREEGGAIGAD